MFLSFSRKSSDFLCPHADNLIFPIPFPLLLLPSASFLSKTPDGHKKQPAVRYGGLLFYSVFPLSRFLFFGALFTY